LFFSCCNKFGLNPNRAFIMSDPNATFSEPTSVAYSAFDATVSRTAYNFELTLKADERTTLAAFQWKSKDRGDVRAMALISHGYAEYLTEDYDRLATFLAADGILVAAHDHLGHGRSDGPQAQTMVDFDTDYVVPIVEHTKHLQAEYPGKPVFLVGHSLGGLMAVLAVGREKEMFKGVVLVSPAVAIDPELATPFAVFMANVLGSILPGMPLNKIPLVRLLKNSFFVPNPF
jgi:alpha-beta hydrolase superfamily lysophospholipase